MRWWWGPVGRPQSTVLVLHPCSSHSYCYQFIVYNFFSFQHFMTACFTLELFPFCFLADKSTDEEVSRPQTKEEEDIDILHSWVQMGGSCSSREGGMGASVRGEFTLFSLFCFSCGILLLFTFLPLFLTLSFCHLSPPSVVLPLFLPYWNLDKEG